MGTGPGVITPDGCAVDFYALVPAGPEPGIVAAAAGPAPALILELGAGAGRITEALAAMGHRAVAVDESADMLARIQTAETIRAPIQDLALGRQFIQQHPPTWFDSVTPAEREEGGIIFRLRRLSRPEPRLVSATAELKPGERQNRD